MTWTKLGVEFFDDCANAGLTDAAARTHAEAIGWLYRIERSDLRIPKHLVRRFAGSDQADTAAKDLVALGFWSDDGDAYVVEHHAEVIRQSMAAQLAHRERERIRQQKKRSVGSKVGTNVAATQTDRQTSSALDGDQQVCSTCWAPLIQDVSKSLGLCDHCRQEDAA